MLAIVLCIVFSSLLTMHFRMHQKWRLDTFQTIVWNYVTCSVGCYLLLGESRELHPIHNGWDSPLPIMIGFLFISSFYVIARSVQQHGLTLATLFQKMSVVIPVSIAIIWYNESTGLLKMLGIALAILSIYLSAGKSKKDSNPVSSISLFLIAAFIGSGLIDFSFYYAQAEKIANSSDLDFIAGIFSTAALIGLSIMTVLLLLKKLTWSWRNLIGGITLGIPNIFSLIYLMRSLESEIEGSLVFPMLNVGILVTASMIDPLLFQQKLSAQKKLSVAVAVISIGCMAWAAVGG